MHFSQGESSIERMADLAMQQAGSPDNRIDGFRIESTHESDSFQIITMDEDS